MPPRIMVCALALVVLTACGAPPPNTPVPQIPQGMGQVSIERVTNDSERESGLRASRDGRYLLFNLSTTGGERRCGWLDDVMGQCAEQISLEYEQTAIAMIELGQPGKSIVGQENSVDPGWFPNSEDFSFSMLQGGQAMLARSRVGSPNPAIQFVAPTPCVEYDRQPSISPDGRRVLFTTLRVREANNIAVMDLRTTTEKCKILFPGQFPQWNPSGRSFAFTRVVSEHEQVFVFDEQRNLLTQITFGDFNNTTPAWSPDGNRIVFATDRNGTWDIYTIGVEGTELIQITLGPTNDFSPTWAPDRSIYFSSNADGKIDIWRARFQAGN